MPCSAIRPARSAALQYGPTEGLAELRDRLTVTPVVQRVAHVAVDDLVVTSGSQQALHLLATVLVDPGDSVVVDDPCYLGARQVLTAAGARLAGVPLDGEGLRVDLLADRLRAGLRPRLVYTVPAYQNPSGAVLGTDRREALVVLAGRYGFVVIEDDAYGVLGFVPGSEEPAAWDGRARRRRHRGNRVESARARATVAVAPRTRGWCAWAVVRVKQAFDLHTSTFTQSVVAQILADAAFLDRHLGLALRSCATPRAAWHWPVRWPETVSLRHPRAGCSSGPSCEASTRQHCSTPRSRTTSCSCRDACSPSRKTGATTCATFVVTLPEPTLRACAEELRSLF